MFDGVSDAMVDVGPVRLRVRSAGSGPVVLLVHGDPRTGAPIESGHHMAEEDPEALAAALTAFLSP